MRVLRKWVALAVLAGVLLPAVSAAPAVGQLPTIELKPRLDLTIGKPKRNFNPRFAALVGRIRHVQSWSPDPSQIISGSLWLPRGLALNPGAIPDCSRRSRLYPGIEGCPDDSIVGQPRYGVAFTDIDDQFTDPDSVFVNGGPGRIWAFMTIYDPALVQELVAIEVHGLRGKKWSYRLDFRIPKVLMVVAGVPISLRSFDLELDGIERAPGYLTLNRRCPRRGHFAYRASLTFLHNDGTTSEASRRSQLRCRGRAA